MAFLLILLASATLVCKLSANFMLPAACALIILSLASSIAFFVLFNLISAFETSSIARELAELASARVCFDFDTASVAVTSSTFAPLTASLAIFNGSFLAGALEEEETLGIFNASVLAGAFEGAADDEVVAVVVVVVAAKAGRVSRNVTTFPPSSDDIKVPDAANKNIEEAVTNVVTECLILSILKLLSFSSISS